MQHALMQVFHLFLGYLLNSYEGDNGTARKKKLGQRHRFEDKYELQIPPSIVTPV